MTPKITLGTKVRTAALFVTLINQILVVFGLSPLPFDEEAIELVVSTTLTGIVSIWAWWKNTNITLEARKAQVYLDELKANKK